MCGIIFAFLRNDTIGFEQSATQIDNIFRHAEVMNARGPDRTSFIYREKHNILTIWYGFHRLAIQGKCDNTQPPFIQNDRALVLCNGEVYPSGHYHDKYKPHEITGQSDCEWILQEYTNDLIGTIELLENSEFATIIFDKLDETVTILRDPFGIRPLYQSPIAGGMIFASELKYYSTEYLNNNSIRQYSTNKYTKYTPSNDLESIGYEKIEKYLWKYVYNMSSFSLEYYGTDNSGFFSRRTDPNTHVKNLYEALNAAVLDRIMYCDAEIGFLLSGGMDSSIICALAQRASKEPIRTFAIGMDPNATDIIAAAEVATFIGSRHETVIFTPEQFLAALPEVIRVSETWDTTTIRAGTGMYLIAKYIRENTNIRVLLTGEGSDELFGSYRYFLNAPCAEEHKNETFELLTQLHYYDVLRCDRTISNNGLEARVPFLDTRVVKYVAENFTPEDYLPKNGMLKPQLRAVAKEYNLLPESIYNRPKEAFSDGVSQPGTRSWHEILQEYYKDYIPKTDYYPGNQVTNESKAFFDMFIEYYPRQGYTIFRQWLPKWCGDQKDPSARALDVSEKYIIPDSQ